MRVRTVVRVGTALLVTVWLAASVAGGRVTGTAPDHPLPATSCALPGMPTGDDPLALVLEAGERSRTHEQRCPPDRPQRRLCRALWLARHLDPVVVEYRSADPPVVRRAADLLAWALEDAAMVVELGLIEETAPDAVLAEALRSLARGNARLSELSGGAVLSGGAAADGERAVVLQARAGSGVLGPLTRAEGRCP